MKNVKNPLIFIVEENQIYRDLISRYLNERKFKNVRTFENGEECLKNIRFNPDVIVLDYSMAGYNGLELMLNIKKKKPRTDFIFLSAQNNVEIAVQHIQQGAFDYIVKNDHAPEKLVKSLISDIHLSRKINLRNALRKGMIGFFTMLIFFILFVVGIRYFLNW